MQNYINFCVRMGIIDVVAAGNYDDDDFPDDTQTDVQSLSPQRLGGLGPGIVVVGSVNSGGVCAKFSMLDRNQGVFAVYAQGECQRPES